MSEVIVLSAEDQSKNGVHVTVTMFSDGGRTVDASCSCHGMDFRVHSTFNCPNRKKSLD